jgi:hypothetical protein
LLLFLRVSQPGRSSFCICFPQEQGSPVIPSGIGLIALQVEVEVTLRLTVSQSVCLGIEHPCGTCDQILLPVGTLLSYFCGAPSLTRGRVCNLQCNHSMVRVDSCSPRIVAARSLRARGGGGFMSIFR